MFGRYRDIAFLFLLTLCTLTFGLGTARLWDRDEPRNARCAVEMYERGDVIVPTFDGRLRTHKPILLYWFQMLSIGLFGVSEWALRLPSAIAGVATVLMTHFIARRFLSAGAATLAAAVLATSLMFVVASRIATPDGLLICFQTLAIALYVRAAYGTSNCDQVGFRFPRIEPVRFRDWFWIYVACGLAILAKGPIGLLLPGFVIGLFHTWATYDGAEATGGYLARGRDVVLHLLATAWRMRPFTAIFATLLVAGPWYAAVGYATDGVWLRDFFFTHNVGRAVSPMEGHEGPGPVFYVGAILMGTFPWSLFAVPLVGTLWQACGKKDALPPAVVLAVCWLATYVGFFSIAATKLPSYVTPCLPGVALLIGWYLTQIRAATFWHRRGLAAVSLVALMIAACLMAAGWFELPAIGKLSTFSAVAMLIVATTLLSTVLWSLQHPGFESSLCIGAALIMVTLFGFGTYQLDQQREVLEGIMRFADRHGPTRIITASAEPSWVFYTDGAITDRLGDLGEALPAWLAEQQTEGAAIIPVEAVAMMRSKLESQGYICVSRELTPEFEAGTPMAIISCQRPALAQTPKEYFQW